MFDKNRLWKREKCICHNFIEYMKMTHGGGGYTEWMVVESAEVLFDGNQQPRVLLNRNHYDLLEKETMKM